MTSLPTTVVPLDIPFHDDVNEYYQHAKEQCDGLDQGEGVLILTDLNGATPANIAKSLCHKERRLVICGVNLPMLLRAINYCESDIAELAEKTLQGGIGGIAIHKQEL